MTHTTDQTAAVYAALVEFQKTAKWPKLALAQIRQHLAEHIAAALPVPVSPAADRAAVLREAADIAESLRQFEPAFGARKSAQVSENVGILRVADQLHAMANDAEYVATPCSGPVPCEDGGEPCDVHERLMGHIEGDHELCAQDCGQQWLRRVAAEEQPAETQDGFELRGTAGIRAAALEEAALIAVAENNTCPAVYQCQPCLTRERVAADLLRAAAKERAAVGEQPDTQTPEADRIVAYRNPALTELHCLRCAPHPAGDIWIPVTAAELEDGGICSVCGVDVLIPLEAGQ